MDKNEFAHQVVEQTDRMYRIAWTILRNDEDCRDAMQEAALKAWERRWTLRETGYFATWLTRILINECRNIQRRRRHLLLVEDITASVAPARDPVLSLALQRLPKKLRLPLVMHSLEGMTYEEISRLLRISKATVTGRIQRARQQLKKELEV